MLIKQILSVHILCIICLRNHFGSETTIIPSSPALLSNITGSDNTTVDNQDRTILNIDTLEVKTKPIFSQINLFNFHLFYSIFSVI